MYFQKNGVLIDGLAIALEDRAFMYGDGCFTTARYMAGQIQLWQRHLQRFAQAMAALQLNCSLAQIEQDAKNFLQHINVHSSGTLKIVISRGVSARGYAVPKNSCDIYFYFYPAIALTQLPKITDIALLDEQLGTPMQCLRGVKSLNRLEQVMLKATVQKQGFNEGLCFDLEDNLVEAISSNCFLYLNKTWVTPDLALTGIVGTMRQEILARMAHYQIDHQVRIIAKSEMAEVEALFLCNALQPMQIVQAIAGRKINDAPCQELFQTLHLSQLV